MNILKINLERLYREKPEFEKFFPFEEYYEKLEIFMMAEIANGREFLNPYKFARVMSIDISRALVFFVYISSVPENRTLRIKYRYTCSHQNDSFLYESELADFICDEDCLCDKDMNLKYAIEEGLVDVPIFFEIDYQLRQSLIDSNSSFNQEYEGSVSNEIDKDIAKDSEMVAALKELNEEETPAFFVPLIEKWTNDLLESREL